MSQTKLSSQRLWRSSAPLVSGSVREVLDACRNRWRVLPQFKRPVGRTFCRPGLNIFCHPEDVYPLGPAGFAIDEVWFGCCLAAVTGNKDPKTRKDIFREGEAHIIDPAGRLFQLQAAVEEDPAFMIGPATAELARAWFGLPTVPIYDKYFDNAEALPHHVHPKKHEAYHHDPLMNTRVSPWHYLTMALGFFPGTPKERVLACLEAMKGPGYNGIRALSPHIFMPLDWGFRTPAGTMHAPAALCTQEPQLRYDEHVLCENKTDAGVIPENVAFLANNTAPPDKRTSWEWVLEQLGPQNWDPEFVAKNQCRPVLDKNMSTDAAQFYWVIYGPIEGKQFFSTIKVVLKPGGKVTVTNPSWSICHMIQGRGRVGELDVELAQNWRIGQLTWDCWFMPFEASREGIEVENTSPSQDMVFKMTFGPDAWPFMPPGEN